MTDVRYSEFLFLQAVAAGKIEHFNPTDRVQMEAIGLRGEFYVEMAIAALENLYVRMDSPAAQQLVARLRGEIRDVRPSNVPDYHWVDPRYGLNSMLTSQPLQRIRITYRGLHRIEDLRDLLRRDRILEHFGVLLDLRYFRPDLQDALNRSADIAVSVIYGDMDDFGPINKKFGQQAGDIVMKAYLEVIRDCVGSFGTAYRGVGDETAALIIGQGHDRAVDIAQAIRKRVEVLRCTHQDNLLPKVTASIGVASTPPATRSMDLEAIAEERKRKAKEQGKNMVVAS